MKDILDELWLSRNPIEKRFLEIIDNIIIVNKNHTINYYKNDELICIENILSNDIILNKKYFDLYEFDNKEKYLYLFQKYLKKDLRIVFLIESEHFKIKIKKWSILKIIFLMICGYPGIRNI